MTTIQDRIIKDFRKILEDESQSIYWTVESGKMNFEIPRIEQFLIQSIKLVQEETRKETFEEVEKLGMTYSGGIMIGAISWEELKEKLSITNKEKQK